MSRPGQVVIIYTLPGLKGEELWDHLWEITKSCGCSLMPAKDTFWIYIGIDTLYLPEEATREQQESILKEAFLKAIKEGKEFGIRPDWGAVYGPAVFAIIPHYPYEPRWGYSIEMAFEDIVFWQQGERLCEIVMELCKKLFVQIPCDFGFACHEYLEERHLRLFKSYRKNAKILHFLATLPNEDDSNYLLVEDNFWSVSYRPVWFYLLNRERYEASKPYLPNLPVEAIERFPGLRDYGVQRIEELSNGGAFIFFGYPYQFDDPETAQ